MIAVVTGSSGFIGSHLTDALIAAGSEVRVLLRPETPVAPRAGAIAFEADVLDRGSLERSGIWDGCTHVFHLGGRTRGSRLEDFRSGNTRPTENILAALHARALSPRFVLMSSQAAAGPAVSLEEPTTELDPCRPVEVYGQSKLEAELAVAHYLPNIPATILRPSAVYGPRDRDFLRIFREASRRYGFYPTPGTQLFSIVHVADVVEAVLDVVRVECTIGQTYFVANREHTSWERIYEAIGSLAVRKGTYFHAPAMAMRAAGLIGDLYARLRADSRPLVTSAKVKLALQEYWLCDSARLTAATGWIPRLTLQQGLRDTYLAYARAHALRPHPTGGAAENPEE